MRKFASYIIYTLLLAAIACACSDNLDIVQDYGYSVETLPLPKKLKNGETVKLEFSILREGNFKDTQFQFRYFQSSGKGLLFDDKGRQYDMNRFYPITSDDFIMLYQSACDEQQQLDFTFLSNFGRKVEYTVEFTSDNSKEE